MNNQQDHDESADGNISKKPRDFVSIFYVNAQSLLGHKYELELFIHEQNIDILCVTETWLHHYIKDALVNIPSYSVYRKDYGKGGGVCLYVKNTLMVTELNLNIDGQEGVEDIWISVQHCKFPSMIVGCIYRHPKANAESFTYIADILKSVILRNKPLFIFGDFNDNLINIGNKMDKLVRSLKLSQVIDKPKLITPTSATILDLVITNNKDMI